MGDNDKEPEVIEWAIPRILHPNHVVCDPAGVLHTKCWCSYYIYFDLEYSDLDYADVPHASAGFVFTLSDDLLIKVLGFALDSLQVWGRSHSVSKMFQRCALNPQACHFGLKPGQSACAKLVRKRRRNPLGWDNIVEYCTSRRTE